MYFGVEESALSINRGEIGHVRCFLPRGAALAPGEKYDCSLVIGFARPGQMRRDFLAYLERERAHPYRPFLTYNTWFDLGYFSKYDEKGLLDRIQSYGTELVTKRHVKLDSFLLDDGWDDSNTLWRPHHGFPNEEASAPPQIWRRNMARLSVSGSRPGAAMATQRRSASPTARRTVLKSSTAPSPSPGPSIMPRFSSSLRGSSR